MAFKVNASFLRFLTIGATGVRHVADQLRGMGFEPIELERYATSNKIWTTKIKRLRVPDLLCVRTGMRIEVRAKTDLKIKMSDAPENPDRVWDAGLRDQDIVAFIACQPGPRGLTPAENAVFFSVEALRQSVVYSTLGSPKSASEGAERDREWPCTVPSRPGSVLSVGDNKLQVIMEGDERPTRRHTYTLGLKHAYVAPGDRFAAKTTILAGVPESLAGLEGRLPERYDPIVALGAGGAIDRLAAAKALPARADLHKTAVTVLDTMLATEPDIRVALEAAGSAAALGSTQGQDYIASLLAKEAPSDDMSMEAVLILSELETEFARQQLLHVAGSAGFRGHELRQAAVWGLGKAGHRSYEDLVEFIGDDERDVTLHAIGAFGQDTPQRVIGALTEVLLSRDTRKAAAASEVLRRIDNVAVLRSVLAVAAAPPPGRDWVLATLGRLSPDMVRSELSGTPLLKQLEPMLLTAPAANWLEGESTSSELAFLLKQNL